MSMLTDLCKPKPLSYYTALVLEDDMTVAISLNRDQAAAIIKAHDHGISQLQTDEIALLDQVMSNLKFEIRD